MGTKNNPGRFDCYGNADADEPMFILLARDIDAPTIVEEWASMRAARVRIGEKPETDLLMVDEARECAKAMRAWRATPREKEE